MEIEKLYEPFPQEVIHWRAQMVVEDFNNKGTFKALALAYLDARDVMDRLDSVCGMGNWQCEHYDCGQGRMGCKIGIKVDGEWIWKTDGAGDTQVEAEKGAFSGALKRAAVAWGVGRYLYDMKQIYVPCEVKQYNGKNQFKKWLGNPWDYVKNPSFTPKEEVQKINNVQLTTLQNMMMEAGVDEEKIKEVYKVDKIENIPFELFDSVKKKLELTKAQKLVEKHNVTN